MKSCNVIFPNQLFEDLSLFENKSKTFLIEDSKFFTRFNFHKNKLVLHRASMKFYEKYLKEKGIEVEYIEFDQNWIEYLKNKNISKIITYELNNFELEEKIKSSGLSVSFVESPMFLSSNEEFKSFYDSKNHYSQTSFYIYMRKKLKVLLDKNLKPEGGKWTFDKDNRQKIPQDIEIPNLPNIKDNSYVKEAKQYIEKHFYKNIGTFDFFNYPTTFEEVGSWVDAFIKERFEYFGVYQDAIFDDNSYLFHSNISFALNIGLITPQKLLEKVLIADVSLNSKEGYIRQIIGWREFVKGIYNLIGQEQLQSNFWKFENKLSSRFYNGETGILPVDDAIKKLLKTGYANHIERLMILGNFFLLCEINPQEVYKWFMEMSIDAYPWVMCANIFGMSQFADGGKIVTKPYISSSNYIKKMSNYKQGDWCEIFDNLFWCFIYKHFDFFVKNPRLKIITSNLERKNKEEISKMLVSTEEFLAKVLKN